MPKKNKQEFFGDVDPRFDEIQLFDPPLPPPVDLSQLTMAQMVVLSKLLQDAINKKEKEAKITVRKPAKQMKITKKDKGVLKEINKEISKVANTREPREEPTLEGYYELTGLYGLELYNELINEYGDPKLRGEKMSHIMNLLIKRDYKGVATDHYIFHGILYYLVRDSQITDLEEFTQSRERMLTDRDIVRKEFTRDTIHSYDDVKLPVTLSQKDLFRFILGKEPAYLYGDNGQYVELVGADVHIRKVNMDQNAKRSILRGERFEYKLLKKINGNEEVKMRDGYCAFDYIYEMISGTENNKFLTKKKLREQFMSIGIDIEDGISVVGIKKLRDKFYKNVSIYAMDGLQHVYASYPAIYGTFTTLSFLTNSGHLYPILNQETINKMIKHKGGSIDYVDIDVKTEFKENEFVYVDKKNYNEFISGTLKGDVFVVDDKIDLKEAMFEVVEKNKCQIEQFDFKTEGILNGFIHPVNTKSCLSSCGIHVRIDVLQKIREAYPDAPCFEFNNQSMPKIAMDIAKYTVGMFPKSECNRVAVQYLDEFSPKPLIQYLCEDIFKENADLKQYGQKIYAFDIAKCHSDCFYHNKADIPVYTIHDHVEDYDDGDITCGEYLMEKTFVKQYKCENESGTYYIILKEAFYSYDLVEYLLKEKIITKKNIKKMIRARYSIKHDAFKKFVEFCFEHFDEKTAKNMINFYIGTLNTKYSKRSKGCICASEYDVNALYLECVKQNQKFELFQCEDKYLVKCSTNTRLTEDNNPIYRHVISGSIKRVFELLKQATTEESNIYGIHTDCIYIDNVNPKFFPDIPKGTKIDNWIHFIGKYREEDVKIGYPSEDGPEKKISLFTPVREIYKGKILNGCGGSGKTHKLVEKIKKCSENGKKYIVFSFTNKAVREIQSRLNSDDMKAHVKTFGKFYAQNKNHMHSCIQTLRNFDYIFVDEFSMMPYVFQKMVYWGATPDNILFMTGDMNQIPAVEDHESGGLLHDIIGSKAFLEVCPNRSELAYMGHRYDEKLYNVLTKFLKTGKIKAGTFDYYEDSYVNICYTNATRKRITRECVERWKKEHNDIVREFEFTYQGKKESYEISEGMPIIATSNSLLFLEIANNEMFTIKDIKTTKVIVSDGAKDYDIPMNLFKRSFILAFCVTCHKYQGGEINCPYNIYDTKSYGFSKNLLYTALSRSTKLEYIHVGELKDQYYSAVYDDTCYCHINDGGKFKNSSIYHIEFEAIGKHYIGSTERKIEARFKEHMTDPKNVATYPHRKEKPVLRLVRKCHVFNQKELEQVEKKYIKIYVEKYGKSNVLNVRMVDEEKKEKKEVKQIPQKHDIIKIRDDEKNHKFIIRVRGKGLNVSKSMKYEDYNKEEIYDEMVEFKNKKMAELV